MGKIEDYCGTLQGTEAQEEKNSRVETKGADSAEEENCMERIKCEGRRRKIREEMNGATFRRKIKG